MDIELKDLISINSAAEKLKLNINDILFHALEGQLNLFHPSQKDVREALVPCKDDGGLFQIDLGGKYLHQYNPMISKIQYVEIQLGEALKLNKKAIKSLILNQAFSEVELYRQLALSLDEQSVEFWKTEREVLEWKENIEEYASIHLDQVHLLEQEFTSLLEGKQPAKDNSTEKPSNTALKAIGLLMHHLAKSPKYTSGSSPNKSQIKELLLDLADEQGVHNYGLSKVDERLLAEAMKYLETQKN